MVTRGRARRPQVGEISANISANISAPQSSLSESSCIQKSGSGTPAARSRSRCSRFHPSAEASPADHRPSSVSANTTTGYPPQQQAVPQREAFVSICDHSICEHNIRPGTRRAATTAATTTPPPAARTCERPSPPKELGSRADETAAERLARFVNLEQRAAREAACSESVVLGHHAS